VLNDRLRELRDAGIVTAEPTGGYKLSSEGDELLQALAPLDAWAQRWAQRTRP
jgi:DNA-binding HxlR family transcriptional regulator